MTRSVTAALILVLAAVMLSISCGEDPYGPGWRSINRNGFEFSWQVDGAYLQVELTAPTTGWVLVGFQGTFQYHDANIIVGYVSGGQVQVRDDFGIDNDTHESDSSLQGGQQNATDTSGSEEAGSTTIGFTIPLDSGDTWDNVLADGETVVLVLARGDDGADDFTSPWEYITSATISL